MPAIEAGARQGSAGSSLAILRRHIDRHLAEPDLDVDRLARTYGLSRSSLYRLFEPIGGVAAYIRQQRLERARLEIVATDRAGGRIGPIAYRWGFKDASAFTRAFRETFGETPREARARTRARFGESVAAPETEVGMLAQALARIRPR